MLSLYALISILGASVAAAPAPAPDTTKAIFPTNFGYLGSIGTASAAFLAQTDAAAIKYGTPTSSYTLPHPIETSIQAKSSKEGDRNIFTLMGTISPYYVSDGFGVYDYGLPGQCTIQQVHLLSRHGTRYPTSKISFANALANKNYTAKGDLDFLNVWTYNEGNNILTPLGNQQLSDKGVRTWFRYGQLYDYETRPKIVARTTSQERITATSEYFLAGFFGLNWQDYANLEIIVESEDFNDTLAPYDNCPVSDNVNDPDSDAQEEYLEKYLADAVNRLNADLDGLTLTTEQVYELQELCSYEVNNNGFSHFCSLFTEGEWKSYEYYLSWTWYNSNMFGSPVGRALGIGWIEEFKQRLQATNEFNWSTLGLQNTTLDTNPAYFPVNQTLYFDFSHDSVISNIFTALGMNQFKSNFSIDGTLGSEKAPFDLSKVVPFASQTYFEIIGCDVEIPANRSAIQNYTATGNGNYKYVHMILNDHTIPLHQNFPEYCETRDDGWCEFTKFVEYLDTLYEQSDFQEACFGGNYNLAEKVTDGHPL